MPVILHVACTLATFVHPSHLPVVDLKINKLLGINAPHPRNSPYGQHKCCSNGVPINLPLSCHLPETRIILGIDRNKIGLSLFY
ncbi:hypothetical protein CQP30_04280 [Yersinia pestis]|nr:hypothetical protein EGX42_08900 [Yersinia pestis]EEO75231.1 hypothetical protein YP516_3128 [Yersinia pestis Nepal516]EEO81666.1 hypothetical protein YPF_1631 [Yersinia pestis biovar Orientalis str. India 195]OUY16877.1 hypothetical protein BFI40_03505 [Yersinia pestis subsp. microtus bv. Altaica]OVY78152.1 hypothetical protein BFI50_03240 [Yersinia pestis subsp. microtus bv. Xilingolensis]OVY85630.1 hypothetical protein BFI52_08250 [Yersinia pestis subsp. microtus]